MKRDRRLRARLDRVSRPRPPIGPALTGGAVDLSALKQPPPAAAETRGDGSAAAAGVEVTEANFEQEVLLRSTRCQWSCCCGRRAVMSAFSWPISCPTWPLPTTANGRWPASTSTWTPRVAQIFGVEVVPPSWHWVPGKPLSSFQGMQPPEQLRRWIDSLLSATAGKLGGAADSDEPEEVDPALAQARQQLEDNDLGAALDSYQAILDADPNHAEAKGACAPNRVSDAGDRALSGCGGRRRWPLPMTSRRHSPLPMSRS